MARLRVVIEAKDAENAVLRAELGAQRERYRRLELRVAELERRLGSDSTTSGTPPSKDPIGARERRTAERKARQSSERERRADRRRGGQPGHPGAGLSRDPDPDEQVRGAAAGAVLGVRGRAGRRGTGGQLVVAGQGRADHQVRDGVPAAAAGLPVLREGQRGEGAAVGVPGQRLLRPGINTAAVLLSSYGNVPAERTANLIGMLLGVPVSPGFVDLCQRAAGLPAARTPGSTRRCRPPWRQSRCWPPTRRRST